MNIILLPTWTLLPFFAVIALLLYILFRIAGIAGRSKSDHAIGQGDIQIPQQIPLSSQPQFSSPFFCNWEPRIKIAATTLYMFTAAFLQSLAAAFLALCFSLLLAVISGSEMKKNVRRVAQVSIFLSVLIIILPFTTSAETGDTIFKIHGFSLLTFNLRGFVQAITITLKAWSVVLLMEPMLFSSPLAHLSSALKGLGIPEKAIGIVNLAMRYMNVIATEASQMGLALKTRGFYPSCTKRSLSAMANLMAMLFIRSYERTQSIQEAMLLRGYHGRFLHAQLPHAVATDWLKGGLMVGAAMLIYFMDQLIWQ